MFFIKDSDIFKEAKADQGSRSLDAQSAGGGGVVVDRSGDDFFAGSALATDQHAGIARLQHFDQVHNFEHGGGAYDHRLGHFDAAALGGSLGRTNDNNVAGAGIGPGVELPWQSSGGQRDEGGAMARAA